MTRRVFSGWQRRVIADLHAIAEAYPGEIEVHGGYQLCAGDLMKFRLRVQTTGIEQVGSGLSLEDQEDFAVTVPATDLFPPSAEVDHLRFLRQAHVLEGKRLCIYLDPAREWDPQYGFGGFIDRLFAWLADAAGGRFNPDTALYHAVGGVLHTTDGAPTVVVRTELRSDLRAQHGWLVQRRTHRFDLHLSKPVDPAAVHIPILTLDEDLPLGAGGTLLALIDSIRDCDSRKHESCKALVKNRKNTAVGNLVVTLLTASALRKGHGEPQSVLLAVPHPAGGPPHLLAATIGAVGGDYLRKLALEHNQHGLKTEFDMANVKSDLPMAWWRISDERPEVTTRRDSDRPVSGFEGKVVHVWGCGGIGSWIAEYVVRAGAKKIVVCDPGVVLGGLLVRQNFEEADVGGKKVDALARRLTDINDKVEVVASDALVPSEDQLADTDVVIDATISTAIGRLLDVVARSAAHPILAQMATDARSGTLGAISISMPSTSTGPATIDRLAGSEVLKDSSLEAYHDLWKPVQGSDELLPTRGCSIPTFHGSAADMAAVASCLTSLLGLHLKATVPASGTHLISLPHADAGPSRRFIPAVGAMTSGPVENLERGSDDLAS